MSASSNIVLLVTAENKAAQVLQQVREQAGEVRNTITEANTRVSESIQKVGHNYLQAGAAFAAVGASVAGFVTSLDNMERAQLRVDIAQKRVNDLVARGREGTEEYRIAQEKLRLAQDNLNDTYTNFVAGIGPQIFTTIFGIQNAMRGLGITSIQQLVPAIRGVGTAFTTTFLTNPVGIAILGISAVVLALALNVGGLRDKVVELGNQILAFLDQHIRPLADAIRYVIDLFRPLADIFGVVMPDNITASQDAVDELESVAVPALENITQEAVNLGTGMGDMAENIQKQTGLANQVIENMGATTTRIFNGVRETIAFNIDAWGKMGRTAIEESERVTNAAQRVRGAMTLIAESGGGTVKTTAGGTSIVGSLDRAALDATFGSVAGRGGRTSTDPLGIARLSIDQIIAKFAGAGSATLFQAFQQAKGIGIADATRLHGLAVDTQLAEVFKTVLAGGSVDLGSGGPLLGGSGVNKVFGLLTALGFNVPGAGAREFLPNIQNILAGLSPETRSVIQTLGALAGPRGEARDYASFFESSPVARGIIGASPELRLRVEFVDEFGNSLDENLIDLINNEGTVRIKTRGTRLF